MTSHLQSWKQSWILMVVVLGLGDGWTEILRADPVQPDATVLWKFRFPSGTTFDKVGGTPNSTSSSTPAITPDGTLYVGSFNGFLHAVTRDGKEKWRFKAGLEIGSSPAVADDGTVYFGSRDRMFYALNPDGSLKWKFATGGWVDSSPAIAADGAAYFGSWDKNFYALNPDGTLKWKFATGAIVDASPAIAAAGTVYFGSHDRYFYALNPDGTVRWKFLTGGEITSSPAIGKDGAVYFSSMDGNLYALNPDGTERWRYHSDSCTRSSPVLDAGGKIAIGNNSWNDIISPDGKKLWHRGAATAVDVSAAAVDGRFYLPAPWRTLEAAVPVDQRVWKLDTMNDDVSSSVTVADDGTIYYCAKYFLYAVRPPDKVLPPAASPWPMFRANVRHTGRVE